MAEVRSDAGQNVNSVGASLAGVNDALQHLLSLVEPVQTGAVKRQLGRIWPELHARADLHQRARVVATPSVDATLETP